MDRENGFPSRSDVFAKAFQLFFLTCSFIVAVFLNGIVSYSLLKKRTSLIAGNLFVFSLTISNLLDSFLSIPFVISSGATDGWTHGDACCAISAFSHLFVSLNSNLTLALIAVDRYYAIVKPMKYHSEFTIKKAAYLLCSAWTFSTLASILPVLGWSTYVYHPSLFICSVSWHMHPAYTFCIFATAVFAPFIIMTVCYTYVYRAVGLQHSTAVSCDADDPQLISTNSVKLRKKLPWLVITYSNVIKARRILVILLFSYALCWAVIVLWVILEYSGVKTDGAISYSAYFFHRMSAICYPLVYGFMNSDTRRTIRRLMCKSKKPSIEPMELVGRRNSASTLASFFDYLPPKLHYGIDSSDILKKLKPVDYNISLSPESRRSVSPRRSPRASRGSNRSKSEPGRLSDKFLSIPKNDVSRKMDKTSPPYGACDDDDYEKEKLRLSIDSTEESDFSSSELESSPVGRKNINYFLPMNDKDLGLVLEVDDGDNNFQYKLS